MLLLHISDIHFRSPDCLNPDIDPDRPIRTRLLQDARKRSEMLGPVDALLVGGDIAFKGARDEYGVAFTWISELARACGCPLEKVYVIPGNHDVDRGVIQRTPATRNVQSAIKGVSPHGRDRELRTQFSDPDTGKALLAPLAAYNDFAKVFSCQVYTPDRLYWKQDLPLEGGVRLRINGLTSTLLSGANGDDAPQGLYLSPLQTVLDPEDDVVHLVLCHHPPDWFMDQDPVDDAICHRAKLHLFGHKHRQRLIRDTNYIRFAAGAVNPDRNEPGWQPGYNFIKLNVKGDGPSRELQIEAHLLEWQMSPEQYRPVVGTDGSTVVWHRIAIPGRVAAGTKVEPAAEADVPEKVVAESNDVEAAMGNEHTRNLVFRFWNLSVSQRRDLALRLKLIDESEMKLDEPERYGRALKRAGERGQIDELARAVADCEKR